MLRETKPFYDDKIFPVKSALNLHSHTVNKVGDFLNEGMIFMRSTGDFWRKFSVRVEWNSRKVLFVLSLALCIN